ncbi:hypothetical protein C8R46DRAFT_1201617, partial [Mycena filopes]
MTDLTPAPQAPPHPPAERGLARNGGVLSARCRRTHSVAADNASGKSCPPSSLRGVMLPVARVSICFCRRAAHLADVDVDGVDLELVGRVGHCRPSVARSRLFGTSPLVEEAAYSEVDGLLLRGRRGGHPLPLRRPHCLIPVVPQSPASCRIKRRRAARNASPRVAAGQLQEEVASWRSAQTTASSPRHSLEEEASARRMINASRTLYPAPAGQTGVTIADADSVWPVSTHFPPCPSHLRNVAPNNTSASPSARGGTASFPTPRTICISADADCVLSRLQCMTKRSRLYYRVESAPYGEAYVRRMIIFLAVRPSSRGTGRLRPRVLPSRGRLGTAAPDGACCGKATRRSLCRNSVAPSGASLREWMTSLLASRARRGDVIAVQAAARTATAGVLRGVAPIAGARRALGISYRALHWGDLRMSNSDRCACAKLVKRKLQFSI